MRSHMFNKKDVVKMMIAASRREKTGRSHCASRRIARLRARAGISCGECWKSEQRQKTPGTLPFSIFRDALQVRLMPADQAYGSHGLLDRLRV